MSFFHLVVFFFSLLQFSSPAFAESPTCSCVIDSNCSETEICNGCDCMDRYPTCKNSSNCTEGYLCNIESYGCFSYACPGSDCPERCAPDVGTCRHYCTADSECGSNRLCLVKSKRSCVQGDEVCASAPKTECVRSIYVRYCADDGSKKSCQPDEVCGPDQRCVPKNLLEQAKAIKIDAEKSKRLRTMEGKPSKKKNKSDQDIGCNSVATDTSLFPKSLSVLLLGLMIGLIRRRELTI